MTTRAAHLGRGRPPADALRFALLTAPPASGQHLLTAPWSWWFRRARWAEVEFAPASASPGRLRRVAGDILVVGHPPPPRDGERARTAFTARCRARSRRAVRAGARVVVLGGPLAGDDRLARGLGRQLGLPVSSGQALAAGALLETCRDLLRWRGVDPVRALSVVLIDPERPGLGMAAAEYVAGWTARLGAWGLEGPRRRALAARLLAASGTVLETVRDPAAGLAEGGLVIDARAAAGRGAGQRGALTGPAVTVDLGLGPGRAPSSPVLRLAGSSGGEEGRRPGSPHSRPPAAGFESPPGSRSASLTVTGVLFTAPCGWSGRPEPSLESGLLSPSLVEAVVVTSCGARLLPPAHQVTAPAIRRLVRAAQSLGFTPGAVTVG